MMSLAILSGTLVITLAAAAAVLRRVHYGRAPVRVSFWHPKVQALADGTRRRYVGKLAIDEMQCMRHTHL